MSAPLHAQQAARLASLHACAILDTPRDSRFDRIVFMAAQILHTPLAMISFVASDRQWFKAIVGANIRETTLENGFCPFAILGTDPLVVEDATADPRFWAMPSVIGPPFVRFYVGVQILDEAGLPLGTLCAVDMKPRNVSREQIGKLRLLAREVEALVLSGRP